MELTELMELMELLFLRGATRVITAVNPSARSRSPQPLIKVKGPLSFHQSHFITPPLLSDVHIAGLMPFHFQLVNNTHARRNTNL